MIKSYISSNGIRVVTDKMLNTRSVAIGLWVKCGSRNDKDITSGTAHFIEHMLFKGTKKRSAKELAEAVDSIGGQMNAFTSAEHTCYYIRVLDYHIEEAFNILSDMFLNSRFQSSDIEREQDVIIQEYKMYNDSPDDFIQDKFFSYVWKNHALGRNIIGNIKTIKNINKKSIKSFMQKFYTPDNLVIAVAGNINHKKIDTLVEKYFSSFTGKKSPLNSNSPIFHPFKKQIQRNIEQTHIIWGVPSFSYYDDRRFSLNVLNNILGDSSSSRLFQTIRENKGLAYFIYSSLNLYTDTGLFYIHAGINEKEIDNYIEVLEKEIKRFSQNSISQKELKKAKEQIITNLLIANESSSSRMNRLGKTAILNSSIMPMEKIIKKIKKVSKNEVLDVANDLFSKKKAAILMLGSNTQEEKI